MKISIHTLVMLFASAAFTISGAALAESKQHSSCNSGISDKVCNRIVGTWFVKDPDAPFPYHMYVFNADGTMQQANPDAGDAHASDSDGKGIWVKDGDRIKGKWMEIIADRATHKYAGRAEISYDIKVSENNFTGTETAKLYDAEDRLTGGPTKPAPLQGKRVTFP